MQQPGAGGPAGRRLAGAGTAAPARGAAAAASPAAPPRPLAPGPRAPARPRAPVPSRPLTPPARLPRRRPAPEHRCAPEGQAQQDQEEGAHHRGPLHPRGGLARLRLLPAAEAQRVSARPCSGLCGSGAGGWGRRRGAVFCLQVSIGLGARRWRASSSWQRLVAQGARAAQRALAQGGRPPAARAGCGEWARAAAARRRPVESRRPSSQGQQG